VALSLSTLSSFAQLAPVKSGVYRWNDHPTKPGDRRESRRIVEGTSPNQIARPTACHRITNMFVLCRIITQAKSATDKGRSVTVDGLIAVTAGERTERRVTVTPRSARCAAHALLEIRRSD